VVPLVKAKLDTMIKDRYDTLINKQGYDFNYVKNPEIASFFRHFFIESICEPGNINHPTYRDFMAQGLALKTEVMAKFAERLQRDSATRILMEQRLGDLKLLKNCTLTPIPAYYLSVNAVEYTKEQNIKQYFHLNTMEHLYSVLKDGKSVAIISYGSASAAPQIYRNHHLAYNTLTELGKTPIALNTGVTILRKEIAQAALNSLGFIKDGHLISANCSQGVYTVITEGNPDLTKKAFTKECHMLVADIFFTGGSLNSAFESYYKSFKE
jgi:hypothetical protein